MTFMTLIKCFFFQTQFSSIVETFQQGKWEERSHGLEASNINKENFLVCVPAHPQGSDWRNVTFTSYVYQSWQE